MAGPSSSFCRVDWKYDAMGRRVRQTSYVLSNGVWQVVEDVKFVSDPELFGRHVAELHATNNSLVRAYIWGLDLSETLGGGGGVGGLLWVRLATGPAAGTRFVCYDGNGNVWNVVSATTGTERARYEYGPFGEPLRLSGPAARTNPFRFSTKRTEYFTGLVLYEYRAYSPTLGRWLSRDPKGEHGGRNLHCFVVNAPPRLWDRLGLDYWIVIAKGVCGINHWVMVGDDGAGGAYAIEFGPDTTKPFSPRRICGRGKFTYQHLPEAATNVVSRYEGVVNHVHTSEQVDKGLAEAAASLGDTTMTYCILINDCRSIVDCVYEKLAENLIREFEQMWSDIVENASKAQDQEGEPHSRDLRGRILRTVAASGPRGGT
ncbi:RHS repeat-associated core domain-containing protein [Limisphaera sp. 4302-co]|uniref:RHS repeat-associated core domain-containing protein n=1 Tax=Limisphaera sp. 4302-co TaxID=3400417 RepID=UPI003C2F4EFE